MIIVNNLLFFKIISIIMNGNKIAVSVNDGETLDKFAWRSFDGIEMFMATSTVLT
jgi:hypothetical protein